MHAEATDIKPQLRQYIAQNMLFTEGPFPYDDDASLLAAGVIDSLGVMELVLLLQETFRVEVRDHDVTPDNFDSINRLAAFVERKSQAALVG